MINSINKNIKIFMLIFNKIGSIKIITPLIFLIILSIFFFIPIKIGQLGVRIDDILILFCIPILVLHTKYVVVEKYIISILLFLFSVLISMIYGYLVMDVSFNSGDINEFIRYCKILLFALLLGYISVTKLSNMTFKIFYYGSFYIIFVGYLQYFNPFGIGKYLSLLYTSESQIYVAIEHEIKRITVTGSGPNDGAIIVAYFILFNFFSFLFTNRKRYLVLFLLLFTVLFFTQSRTVLIATVFSLICIFFTLKGYWTKKIFLLIVISSGIVVLFPLFSYVFIGIQLFFEGENNSISVRLENAQIAYKVFLNSPIFGYGIAKFYFVDITMDSEWLSLISRFGLFGVITSISLLCYPFFLKKQIEKISNNNLKIYYFTLLASCIIGVVVMLTNNFITGYQSFLPLILLMVLSVRLFNKAKKCIY
ncbi:O-antigen ligase family protein [Aliarcobacter butzleri]|uniref:O-antigen ligase family protein n=1 Tax=Aliarcobacter butzleri TaxID=28197 RepID=UPI0021B1AF58|nr:O-antigen ligase family protein [Aliarcobacter butzleri]MCT7597605.1 O-antigen ligase family protein [Aliarcobacter butzleri]